MEKTELIRRFETFLAEIFQKMKKPPVLKLELLKPTEADDRRFSQWRRN